MSAKIGYGCLKSDSVDMRRSCLRHNSASMFAVLGATSEDAARARCKELDCLAIVPQPASTLEGESMTKLFKTTSLACVGLAMSLLASAAPAEARSRGANAAIVGGIIAGAIIAGAATRSYAGERVYTRSSGCGEYRRRAISNEEAGRPGRAQYWWDRYAECRGE